MRNYLNSIFFGLLFFYGATSYAGTSASGGAPTSTDTWYKHKAEGWHFYNEIEEQEEQEPEKENPAPSPSPVKETPLPKEAVSAPAPVGPPAMSVEWFKKYLPAYRAAAIDNATEENIKAYFMLQKIAADKATVFEEKADRYITGDYVLDEGQRRPINSYGSKLQSQIAVDSQEALLRKIAQKAGILYFFDDSVYSKSMNGAFQTFKNINPDFATIAISSKPGIDSPFQNVRADQGRSSAIGIQAFPALVLVVDGNQTSILSQSPITLDSIHSSIIYASVKLGIITETDLDSTRHYRVRPEDKPTPVNNQQNELPIDPKKIIQMVNKQ